MTVFKSTILFIHRWLGFISGLVVFIVSITGCIYCFQDEIQDAMYSYRKVEQSHQAYVLPSVLQKSALQQFPGATANYIYYYGKDRPAGVLVNTKKEGYIELFYNPYTAQFTHREILAKNFFTIVEYIHLYLLLPANIGQLVVGISVLIFVVLMITGIVLWWPKRKSDRKRSFTIKWGSRWRRVNYDLHNVLGFYATSIALILALSGLSMAFSWVQKGIYLAGNFGKSYAIEKNFNTSVRVSNHFQLAGIADKAFVYAQEHSPNAQMFLVSDDTSPNGTASVIAYARQLHFDKNDIYDFDRYSGKLIRYLPNAKKSSGLRLNDMNYDIHVGQVLGLPGKIIAFLASLICASLPITGFIIWLGKRNKQGKKTKQLQHAVNRRKAYKQAG